MRNNDLTDFNMYEQSLTLNVKQPTGAYSEQATPPPNVGDKTITENGDYSASDDGLDGFANVHVDVSGSAEFSSVIAKYGLVRYISGKNVASTTTVLYLKSANGEYVIDMSVSGIPLYVVLLDPVNKLTVNNIKTDHIDIPTISFTSNVDDLLLYYDNTSKGMGSPDRIYKGRSYALQGYWTQAGSSNWTLETQTYQLSTAPNIIINT